MGKRVATNFPKAVREFLQPHLLRGTPFPKAWERAMASYTPREMLSWDFAIPESDGSEADSSPLEFMRNAFRIEYEAKQLEMAGYGLQPRPVKRQLILPEEWG
jgi:hypothetical protein